MGLHTGLTSLGRRAARNPARARALRALLLAGLSAAFLAAPPSFLRAGEMAVTEDLMLPVPTVTVYPGDVIKPSMLRMQAYPSTFRSRAAVIDAAQAIVGRSARRMLLPGEPVPVNAIDDPRLVSRGAPTQLVFEEDGLVITTVGAALQNGGMGDLVRVRNADTGRIVMGTVMADGRIRIGDR